MNNFFFLSPTLEYPNVFEATVSLHVGQYEYKYQ